MRSKSLAGHEVGLARLSAKLIAFLELARGAGISHGPFRSGKWDDEVVYAADWASCWHVVPA